MYDRRLFEKHDENSESERIGTIVLEVYKALIRILGWECSLHLDILGGRNKYENAFR